jgi:hypothetical protein
MKKAKDLEKALASARTPADVWDLLWQWQGNRSEALYIVAEWSPVFDESLIRAILTGVGPYLRLVENPACGPEHDSTIALWLARRIEGETLAEERNAAAAALKVIMQRGGIAPESPAFQILVPIALGQDKRKFTDRTERAVEAILAHPAPPAELLEKLEEVLERERRSKHRAMLGIHPAVGSEIRTRAITGVLEAGIGDYYNILIRFIETPHVREDPALRPHLLRRVLVATHVKPLQAFAETVAVEDWLPVLRVLLREGSSAAAVLTQRYGDELAPLLTLDDLQALLGSENSEVRMYGVRWAGRVKHATPGAEASHFAGAEPPRRAVRRR